MIKIRRIIFWLLHFRFLDKAAILEDKNNPAAEKQNLWRLATVTKVEELKLVLNVIPIWVATLPFGICIAQSTTFFIKQSVTMNRKIGNGFVIPPASIYSLAAIGMIISVTIYEKFLVPMLRNTTGNERGLNLLKRIGIGMSFTIVTMVIAASVERKRLGAVENAPKNGALSMSVFWLAPQYLIIGFGDGFALVGLQEYFYDQVPDSMRSLGIALYLSVIGASNFLSSWLITAVDRVTRTGGSHGWFGKDLNSSRLDKFYWLLAAISAVNMFFYVFLARRYTYKNVQRVAVADCNEGDDDHGVMV
jgi:peptide/histidine transporter 3/4